jgi:hypothetical protein
MDEAHSASTPVTALQLNRLSTSSYPHRPLCRFSDSGGLYVSGMPRIALVPEHLLRLAIIGFAIGLFESRPYWRTALSMPEPGAIELNRIHRSDDHHQCTPPSPCSAIDACENSVPLAINNTVDSIPRSNRVDCTPQLNLNLVFSSLAGLVPDHSMFQTQSES